MSDEADNLNKQLKLFGLNSEQANVYLHLLKNNSQSALKLSKALKIARTKVYRIIDKLVEAGLVAEKIDGYGKKFTANNPNKLIDVLNQKEKELLTLRLNAPTILKQLESINPLINPETKILHYKGVEGLKQVTWNSTKVEGVFRIYEFGQSMEGFLGSEFSEKVRYEYIKDKNRHNSFRQLTNHKEITHQTNIKEMVDRWECRFIPKEKLNIRFEIQIYNDVYCMYEYTNNEVFIVEIYNKDLAEVQKQIFDIVWDSATPMKKVNDKGYAKLIE